MSRKRNPEGGRKGQRCQGEIKVTEKKKGQVEGGEEKVREEKRGRRERRTS